MEYKRLTTRNDGEAQVLGIGHKIAFERLAAYEDTEHSPDDLQMMIRAYSTIKEELSSYRASGLSHEQVQEIAKAKAEGQLLELPCKVGNKVWLILETLYDTLEIVGSVVTKIFHTNKSSYISCWIDCPGIGNSLEFQFSDFGKAVFLTKEEAEKALKSGGDTQ